MNKIQAEPKMNASLIIPLTVDAGFFAVHCIEFFGAEVTRLHDGHAFEDTLLRLSDACRTPLGHF
jgi:hypothetical protein